MNFYNQNSSVIQPKREITLDYRDIFYDFKPGDRLDQIAYEFYGIKTASRIIMLANPQFYNEFEIKVGDVIRIPMPLERVTMAFNLE